jgi:cell division transport system permease protein
MNSSFEKYQKRRLISSYFSVVLSIFLVLFLLGALGLFVINSKKLSDNFKEEIPMTVFFEKDANKESVERFGQFIGNKPYTNTSVFVTKEEAAEQHQKDLGENFVEHLGANPLSDSYDIRLKADYVVSDSLTKIVNEIKAQEDIKSVNYDNVLVDMVNENIKKISFWILVVSGFFCVIAVLLINSSLRLSIYANRFIIKTMQMVGATKSFIRRPFVWRNIRLGIIGAVLAIIALYAALYYVDQKFPKFEFLKDYEALGIVFGGVLLIGVFITWISTFFATQRFLNLRTDDLY